MKLVTITTDFGVESEGQGIMEATILTICPTAHVVQLCHSISSFSVIEGARQLECAATLGGQAIHVGVIDPGVGTERRAVALLLPDDVVLVGPDNGVLISAARKAGGILMARQITSPRVLRIPISTTFHGRDIFASAAGHLAAGVGLEDLGPEIAPADLVDAPYTEANWENGSLDATVIRVNRFGNCILNARESDVFNAPLDLPLALRRGDTLLGRVVVAKTFGSVPAGSALIYPDSYGRIGLANNRGNIASQFGLAVGDRITLEGTS